MKTSATRPYRVVFFYRYLISWKHLSSFSWIGITRFTLHFKFCICLPGSWKMNVIGAALLLLRSWCSIHPLLDLHTVCLERITDVTRGLPVEPEWFYTETNESVWWWMKVSGSEWIWNEANKCEWDSIAGNIFTWESMEKF